MTNGVILVTTFLLSPIFAQESNWVAHSKDDAQLDQSIRSGDVASMREAEHRREPLLKRSLEWVAENYKDHVGAEFIDPAGHQIIGPNESLTRNEAKVELAKWGEKKYFEEFVGELSALDIQTQYKAIDYLQRIDNIAALKPLIAQIDNPAVIKKTGDQRLNPIGVSAAGAISVIATSNLGMARPIWGTDYRNDDEFRAFWKKWWQVNKAKYGDIAFEKGWLKGVEQNTRETPPKSGSPLH